MIVTEFGIPFAIKSDWPMLHFQSVPRVSSTFWHQPQDKQLNASKK